MTLKTRLVLAFLSLVTLLGGATAFVGSRLVDRTILREAQYRTTMDLRGVRTQLDDRLAAVKAAVENASRRMSVQAYFRGVAQDKCRAQLESDRVHGGLDVLSLCDAEGSVLLRTRHPYKVGGYRLSDPLVEEALRRGRAAKGLIVLNADELALEGSDLPSQAFLNLVETPRAKPRPETTETSGLMLWAAAPIVREDGKITGAAYGGILLNHNEDIVDSIRDVVYGDEKYDDKPMGTVTFFLRDVRVATNVRDAQGNRAVGTRVSAEVYDRVFENGLTWYDRAFVVNEWNLTAYEPLRDPRDKIIGILYTGILEKKYTDLKNVVLRSFWIPVAVALAAGLALSLLLAQMVVIPVQELVAASGRIAHGNYEVHPPRFHSCPELVELADSFKSMSQAIHQRDVELRRKNGALEESNELLTQLNKNYLEMLSFVSHELKSPLNSMIFGTASLRDGHLGPLNEEQKKTLTVVLKNTEYLEEMVVRYLNLSRIEKGELDVHKRNIDLSRDVLAPLLPAIQVQLQAAKMSLENLVAEPFPVSADPGLLRVVLENLLSNGAKYGREGGRIEVGADREGSENRIWVKNAGDGIPPEDLGRLFQKFVRLPGAPGHQRKGTGLGLFICREIVAKHGGRIWAESEPGRWAKFIFTLPKA